MGPNTKCFVTAPFRGGFRRARIAPTQLAPICYMSHYELDISLQPHNHNMFVSDVRE